MYQININTYITDQLNIKTQINHYSTVSTQNLSNTKDLINYTPKVRLSWMWNQQQWSDRIFNAA